MSPRSGDPSSRGVGRTRPIRKDILPHYYHGTSTTPNLSPIRVSSTYRWHEIVISWTTWSTYLVLSETTVSVSWFRLIGNQEPLDSLLCRKYRKWNTGKVVFPRRSGGDLFLVVKIRRVKKILQPLMVSVGCCSLSFFLYFGKGTSFDWTCTEWFKRTRGWHPGRVGIGDPRSPVFVYKKLERKSIP